MRTIKFQMNFRAKSRAVDLARNYLFVQRCVDKHFSLSLSGGTLRDIKAKQLSHSMLQRSEYKFFGLQREREKRVSSLLWKPFCVFFPPPLPACCRERKANGINRESIEMYRRT